jgi:hypothetical protein
MPNRGSIPIAMGPLPNPLRMFGSLSVAFTEEEGVVSESAATDVVVSALAVDWFI